MFRFKVEKVDFLSAAKIWCLTGKLLCGEIRNGSTAFFETGSGAEKIKIETVAFVDSLKRVNEKHLTLTVKGDEKLLPNLTGALLLSTLPESAATV